MAVGLDASVTLGAAWGAPWGAALAAPFAVRGAGGVCFLGAAESCADSATAEKKTTNTSFIMNLSLRAYFTGSHTQDLPNGEVIDTFLKPPTTVPSGVLSLGWHSLVPNPVMGPGPSVVLITGGGGALAAAEARASGAAATTELSANSRSERRANAPLNVHAKVISLVVTSTSLNWPMTSPGLIAFSAIRDASIGN